MSQTGKLHPVLSLVIALMAIAFLTQCKKDKTQRIKGQLLLSKKYPTPIANRKIRLYQKSSPSGILFNTTTEDAEATSDQTGHFNLTIKAGRSYFGAIGFSYDAPFNLVSESYFDRAFPTFSRYGFPDSLYDASLPTYIGKVLDTAIINIKLSKDIFPTDSFEVRISTVHRDSSKIYTGLSGLAGDIIKLDTFYEVLFTSFVGAENKFANSVYLSKIYAGQWGMVRTSMYSNTERLSPDDEKGKTITYSY